ncbi:hypothetical protein Bbelb_286930 [Branchiostoma belcheri]|nr:hypothetical protein Bbelb_286930 [Branchiostoma belcheri]
MAGQYKSIVFAFLLLPLLLSAKSSPAERIQPTECKGHDCISDEVPAQLEEVGNSFIKDGIPTEYRPPPPKDGTTWTHTNYPGEHQKSRVKRARWSRGNRRNRYRHGFRGSRTNKATSSRYDTASGYDSSFGSRHGDTYSKIPTSYSLQRQFGSGGWNRNRWNRKTSTSQSWSLLPGGTTKSKTSTPQSWSSLLTGDSRTTRKTLKAWLSMRLGSLGGSTKSKASTSQRRSWLPSRRIRNGPTQADCSNGRAGTAQPQPRSPAGRAKNKDSRSTTTKLDSHASDQYTKHKEKINSKEHDQNKEQNGNTGRTDTNRHTKDTGNAPSDRRTKNTGNTDDHKHTQNTGNARGNRRTQNTGNAPGNRRTQDIWNTHRHISTIKAKAKGRICESKIQALLASNEKNRGTNITKNQHDKNKTNSQKSKTKLTKEKRINQNKDIGAKPAKKKDNKPTKSKDTIRMNDKGIRNGKEHHPKAKSNTNKNHVRATPKTIEKAQSIGKRTTTSSVTRKNGDKGYTTPKALTDAPMLAKKAKTISNASARHDNGCSSARLRAFVAKIQNHSAKIYHSQPKNMKAKCTTTFGLYNQDGRLIKKTVVNGNAAISLSNLNSSSVYTGCFYVGVRPVKRPKCIKFTTKGQKKDEFINIPLIAVSATCVFLGLVGLAALMKWLCFPKVKASSKTENNEVEDTENNEEEDEKEEQEVEYGRIRGFITKLYITRARLSLIGWKKQEELDKEPDKGRNQSPDESDLENTKNVTLPCRLSVVELDQVETVSNEQTCVEFEDKDRGSTSTDSMPPQT